MLNFIFLTGENVYFYHKLISQMQKKPTQNPNKDREKKTVKSPTEKLGPI